jgi:hypothetical protein
MLCQMLAVGISFVALTLFASAKAREGADEELFRENAPKFHLNFSVGEFDRNGLLVTPDIEVDSIRQIRRPQKLCKTDSKFNVTFPGMQLRDYIVLNGQCGGRNFIVQAQQGALTAIRRQPGGRSR